jgi:hypothetical protein
MNRAYSFGEMKFKAQPQTQTRSEAVVIVDTFSTGAMLADIMYKRGFKIVCVLSGDLKGLLDMIPEGLDYSFASTLVLNSSIEPALAVQEIADQLRAMHTPVVAVFAGAETGTVRCCSCNCWLCKLIVT